MAATQNQMSEFKDLLATGTIQKAYQELVSYMMGLKNTLSQKYSGSFSTGSLYQGYMDMSYFAFTPETLRALGLKIAIVFVYEPFRFEIWLAANNKKIQEKYWNLIRERSWDKYHVVPAIQGYDSILEHVLVDDPDFSDPQALSKLIDDGLFDFIHDVESYLARQI
jgi:hypothetical protein